jgi:UDP-N-acetylglucosamine 4,6-dehydratase
LYAFQNGNSGDIFVQKAPASTIGELAEAMKILYNYPGKVNLIGARHSEKLYETLLAREEMIVAEDLGGFFRVAADNRDLNYNKYFTEGSGSIDNVEDYNSHNTVKLSQVDLIDMLKKIGYTGKNSELVID